MKLLKEIAMIGAGVPFRGKVTPLIDGQHRLVQIKDVDKDLGLRTESLIRVEADEAREWHFLQKGDVLFVARGARNDAVVFSAEKSNVIAGAQFFIIRPTTNLVPEYLAWYLNQERAQRHIAEYTSGSFVPFVPKAALETLEVVLPTVEEQVKIVAIHALAVEEGILLDRIKEKRRQFADTVLRAMLDTAAHTERLLKTYQ